MTTEPPGRPQSATSLSRLHLCLLFSHWLFVRCTGQLCVFCPRRCPEGLSQTVLPGGGRARTELGKDPRGLPDHLWNSLAGASRAVHLGLGRAALDCEPRLWLTSVGGSGRAVGRLSCASASSPSMQARGALTSRAPRAHRLRLRDSPWGGLNQDTRDRASGSGPQNSLSALVICRKVLAVLSFLLPQESLNFYPE